MALQSTINPAVCNRTAHLLWHSPSTAHHLRAQRETGDAKEALFVEELQMMNERQAAAGTVYIQRHSSVSRAICL